MTEIAEFNKPAFDEAAKYLSKHFAVINPATNFGGDQSMQHSEYMRYSIHQPLNLGCDLYAQKLGVFRKRTLRASSREVTWIGDLL